MDYSIKKLESGLLLFTIERQEKRNAVNFKIMDGLGKLLEAAMEEDIKAVAITGAGDRAFCSGGDLSEFHSLKTKEEALPMLAKMAGILYSLLVLPKPTLAILNGAAVGGGCEIAAACDFRIARDGIKAGFIQGKQGIITGWGGGSILAEKMQGPAAMRLLMEGEPKTSENLLKMGFLDSLYEGDAAAAGEKFLSPMLNKEAGVLGGYKTIWINKWESTRLQSRIEKEVDISATLWGSEAHHRQVARFLGKS